MANFKADNGLVLPVAEAVENRAHLPLNVPRRLGAIVNGGNGPVVAVEDVEDGAHGPLNVPGLGAIVKNDSYDDLFTPDADIAEIVNNDRSINLTGYVDEVEDARELGLKAKYKLLKFVLNNNGSKRIQILLWGDALIEKYQDQIQVRQIIAFERLSSKEVMTNYVKAEKGLIPFELSIQNHTSINFLGRFNPQENERMYEDTTIEEVDLVERYVHIDCIIRTTFTMHTNRNNRNYFSGTVCDRTLHKVDVHLKNDSERIRALEVGQTIDVYGIIVKTNFPMYIQVEDPTNIIENKNESMTLKDIRRSVKVARRLVL